MAFVCNVAAISWHICLPGTHWKLHGIVMPASSRSSLQVQPPVNHTFSFGFLTPRGMLGAQGRRAVGMAVDPPRTSARSHRDPYGRVVTQERDWHCATHYAGGRSLSADGLQSSQHSGISSASGSTENWTRHPTPVFRCGLPDSSRGIRSLHPAQTSYTSSSTAFWTEPKQRRPWVSSGAPGS